MSHPSPQAYVLLALSPVLILTTCLKPATPPPSALPPEAPPDGAPAGDSVPARPQAPADAPAQQVPPAPAAASPNPPPPVPDLLDSGRLSAADFAEFLTQDQPADRPLRFTFSDDLSPELVPTPAPHLIDTSDVWSRLRLPLGEYVTVRPIGASRLMPGAMMAGPRDQVGPGAGIGLQMQPSEHWRLGLDLIVRAERLDPDHMPADWAGYVVPGIEYTPTPQAATPMYIGIVAPMSIGARENRQGLFFFIRWEEVFGHSKRHR